MLIVRNCWQLFVNEYLVFVNKVAISVDLSANFISAVCVIISISIQRFIAFYSISSSSITRQSNRPLLSKQIIWSIDSVVLNLSQKISIEILPRNYVLVSFSSASPFQSISIKPKKTVPYIDSSYGSPKGKFKNCDKSSVIWIWFGYTFSHTIQWKRVKFQNKLFSVKD